MASAGKLKSNNSGQDAPKRRKVGFVADDGPTSCNANDCLKIHLVLPDAEEETFDPEFSERIFGDDGKIHGYKGLKIDLWLHPTTFNAYVEIRYDSKTTGGRKPITDVLAKLKEVFGDSLMDDRDTFFKSLHSYSQTFQKLLADHGEVVASGSLSGSTSVTNENSSVHKKESSPVANFRQVVRIELKDVVVRAWHAHLTPLCLLFIEGAQPIQSDDPLWEVYVTLEGEGENMKVVGFCNVYRFYHYPDSTRLRISQILVLPPYQGKGFGLYLLEVVNTIAAQRSCYDVTMEEPSVALQKLRDTMDVLRLLSLPSVNAAILGAIDTLNSRKDSVTSRNAAEMSVDQTVSLGLDSSHGFSQISRVKEKNVLLPPAHLVEEVRKNLKVSKMQFRRCWEQLLFMHLDPNDKDLHDTFQEALVYRLSLEIFEKEGDKSVSKQIFDSENEFDDSKTFVMIPRKINGALNGSNLPLQQLSASENVEDPNSSLLVPGPEDRGKVLEEELQERNEELFGVAQIVARHCTSMNLTIPSLQTWNRGLAGRIEN